MCHACAATHCHCTPSASVPEAGNVLKSVQSTSAGTSDAANLRVQVLSLPDQLLTNRLVAQTAAQPGLLTCWLDLLAPDATSTNFVCVPLPPEMETQTYRNIRRWVAQHAHQGRSSVCALNGAQAQQGTSKTCATWTTHLHLLGLAAHPLLLTHCAYCGLCVCVQILLGRCHLWIHRCSGHCKPEP